MIIGFELAESDDMTCFFRYQRDASSHAYPEFFEIVGK